MKEMWSTKMDPTREVFYGDGRSVSHVIIRLRTIRTPYCYNTTTATGNAKKLK